MELELHHVDAGQALATIEGVVVRVITTATTNPEDLDALSLHIDALLEGGAGWAGLWIVVHHGAPVPSISTRRYAGKVFKPYGDKIAVVYSMLGLGFWTSLAISATRSLSKFIGMSAPIELSIEDGAQRLAQEFIGRDPAVYAQAHAQLLAHIQAAK